MDPRLSEVWVERWHGGAGGGLSLADYLSLSRAEYAAWAEGRMTDDELESLSLARDAPATIDGGTQ